MNYKKLRLFYIACLVAVLFNSCTGDFININTNPYRPREEDMRGDNNDIGTFFTQLEMNVIPVDKEAYLYAQNWSGDIYSGYMASSDGLGPDNKTTSLYFFRNSVLDAPFTGTYANILGAWMKIKRKMDGRTNGQSATNHIYQTVQIIKIAAMSRFTDMWGPMPYIQAGRGGLSSPYDSQETIYHSFFGELGQAITVLKDYVKTNPNQKPLKKFDLVYDGDYTKWIRFANSLRLRLAMRIVYVDPQLAKKEAQASINDDGGLIEGNNDNAAVKSSHSMVINNPLKFIWDADGNCRAGADIVSYMVGLKDPRLKKYFQISGFDQFPYLGLRRGIKLDDKNKYLKYSSPNIFETTPLMWMNAAEVYFLKSEAALLGWTGANSAKYNYEKGIQMSFDQWNCKGYDIYISDQINSQASYESPDFKLKPVSNIHIKWDDSANQEVNLERIITQKWLAIYPNGTESWAEYRRTGYPRLFTIERDNYDSHVANTPMQQIARYPYPNTEYMLNAENINKGVEFLKKESSVQQNFGDSPATRLWWDKKNKNIYDNK